MRQDPSDFWRVFLIFFSHSIVKFIKCSQKDWSSLSNIFNSSIIINYIKFRNKKIRKLIKYHIMEQFSLSLMLFLFLSVSLSFSLDLIVSFVVDFSPFALVINFFRSIPRIELFLEFFSFYSSISFYRMLFCSSK